MVFDGCPVDAGDGSLVRYYCGDSHGVDEGHPCYDDNDRCYCCCAFDRYYYCCRIDCDGNGYVAKSSNHVDGNQECCSSHHLVVVGYCLRRSDSDKDKIVGVVVVAVGIVLVLVVVGMDLGHCG